MSVYFHYLDKNPRWVTEGGVWLSL